MKDESESPANLMQQNIDGLLLFMCYMKGWEIMVTSESNVESTGMEKFITIKKPLSECDRSLTVKDNQGTIGLIIDENDGEMVI